MSKESILVSQSGADTFTSASISTGLTADGKAGWNVIAIEAYWADAASVPAADWSLSAVCQTVATATLFGEDDEVARVSWGVQNTAGVAVAYQYEPYKASILFEPRVTVQPTIYFGVASSNTGQSNNLICVVYYEIVKLSDIEVLRLLAGGA